MIHPRLSDRRVWLPALLFSCLGIAGLPASSTALPLPDKDPAAPASPRLADKARALSVLSSLPATFEPNRGQSDPSVKFLSRGPGYSLFLTESGAALAIPRASASRADQQAATSFSVLKLKLLGADRRAPLEGVGLQTSISNYFLGNCTNDLRTAVPNFARVRYTSIYPGIDLLFHGDPSHLEFDLDLAPGADLRRVRFRLDGANELSLDTSGDLVARIASTELRLHRPVAFQPTPAGNRPITAEFVLSRNREISFRVAHYDTSLPLIIDPVLSYASFLGGSGAETAFGVALDPQHNFYIAGQTASANFPVSGSVQATFGGLTDAFVLKIKSDGSGLAYSTFLGGSLSDAAQAITVDSLGNAYVTGVTSSLNFPTKTTFQSALKGSQDIFVTKLSPDGSSLVFSTYLGGSALDTIASLALDASNNVVLAGTTKSTDFPVVNALEPTLSGTAGNSDAFVAKLKADGSGLIFSTYLGGTGVDGATGVAVSSTGNIWVAGGTGSADFPVVNARQSTFGGGGVTNISPGDAFLAEFKPDGSALLFSTFWGGSNQEQATSLSLDANDNVFLVGETNSANFPTQLPFQSQLKSASGFNAFITKFSADGSAVLFSTYLGGTGSDLPFGSAVDSTGNIFISGSTSSTNLPLANDIQSANAGGATDGFISQLSADGSALLFSTYLGGSGTDSFNRIAIDSSAVYVVGNTDASDFPTVGTPINAFAGSTDGVIVRLAGFTPAPDLSLAKNHNGALVAGTDGSYTLTVTNIGNGPTTGTVTVTDTLPTGLTYSSASGTNWSCNAAAQIATCTNPGPVAANATSVLTLNVHVAGNAPSSLTNTASVSTSRDTNSSNDSASDIAFITGAPAISISFGSPTIALHGSTALTFTINNPGATGFTGLAFTDTLPTGLVVGSPNALATTCSGTVTAVAASSSISLSGATLAAGGTCTVSVNVTANTLGVFSDSASVSSANGGPGNTSTASLSVLAPFTLATSFNPASILINGTSTLSFTFTNPNSGGALSASPFANTLPAGIVLAPNVFTNATTTCNAGVATAAADGTSFTVQAQNGAGVTLAAGASCKVTVQVTGSAAGTFTNTLSVDCPPVGPSNTSTASLTITKPAAFVLATAFSPSSILINGTSTLSFTFTNPNPSGTLSASPFTDNLPAGVVLTSSAFSTATTTCTGGLTTIAAGNASFTVQGPITLAAGATCKVTVPVTASAAGTFTNSLSVDCPPGGASNTSTASLTVTKPAPLVLATAFNPSSISVNGISTLSFGFNNPNSSGTLSASPFANNLPAGIILAPNVFTNATTTCNAGIATAAADGTSFTVQAQNGAGVTLAAGASCTVTVQVTGATIGTFTNSLSVDCPPAGTSNTSMASLTVTSSAPVATISPTSLTFATQLLSTSSASQTVTLKNTGNAALTISNASASGDFSQTNNCGASLTANASCTFTIIFTPTAAGSRTGSLSIADNASGSPHTVSLTGTGADFQVGPASGSTTSATVARGQTASYNLSVGPTAGLAGNFSFTCAGAPSEATCTVPSGSVAANGSSPTNFAVTVTTTAASTASAQLRVPPTDQTPQPNPAPILRLALWLALFSVGTMALVVRRFSGMHGIATLLQTGRLRRLLAHASAAAVFFTLLAGTIALNGCAGGNSTATPPNPGTPAGNYNLTVTATFTSGTSTLKHNITLTLNVQ